MIKSMTGYGRGQFSADGFEFTVEIKSVNHRYFDFSVRTPRGYAFAEDKLKSHIQQRVSRGKLDAFITVVAPCAAPDIEVNEEFAGRYVDALKKLVSLYGLRDDISVGTVARNPDVFTVKSGELDEDSVCEMIKKAADAALDSFIAMRTAEGEKLAADVRGRLAFIKSKVEFIEARSPETLRLYRERLEQKMRELLDDKNVDEQRLLTETAIFADKIAVDEETVRLKSHISQLEKMLDSDQPVGRKIDFTVQEMNREANTIGSKAQDMEIASAVVEIKSEIEKIREQIQNIE